MNELDFFTKSNDAIEQYNYGSVLLQQGKNCEAEVCFRNAIKINPNFSRAYNNLGVVLSNTGKKWEALTAYQQAVNINPSLIEGYINIGLVFLFFEKFKEAKTVYQMALKLDPKNEEIKHRISALSDKTTKRAPPEYIESMFNQYALHFEEKLVNKLDYNVPTLLRNAIDSFIEKPYFKRALDLGCGTGLVGKQIREITGCLVGVDLSRKMLKMAKDKEIYDNLKHSEIIEFLNEAEENFDLIISADVFIYFGDLTPVFESIKTHSAKPTIFAFTTEVSEKKNFCLSPNGRFTHSKKYIFDLASDYNFSVERCQLIDLRLEKGKMVKGNLFLLKR